MTEHDVALTDDAIRALLTNQKSQARAILHPQPERRFGAWYWQHPNYDNGGGCNYFHTQDMTGVKPAMLKALPYRPGDLICVLEAWCCPAYRKSTGRGDRDLCLYRADHPNVDTPKWETALGMPRWASRLTLRVTDVRIQQIQNITHADIIAEGIRADRPKDLPARPTGRPDMTPITWNDGRDYTARAAFWRQWNGAVTEERHTWEANPFVIALSFEAYPRNIDDVRRAA